MTTVIELPVRYASLGWPERRAVREEYARRQKGKCMFCRAPLSSKPPEAIMSKSIDWSRFPKNFLRHPVHLQHDHKNGMTEGAVHAYCNAVLWQYHGR